MAAITVLGIETSCDETAAAVVRGAAPGPGEILSNVVLSQIKEHAVYGGVVPEIAARAHVEALDAVIEMALAKAAIPPERLDAVAATAGPGLIGAVMVGLTTGKALSLAWKKPLIAINHLEAHALTVRLTNGVNFPYLLLLVSGGHCQIVTVRGVGDFQPLGTTIDDAAGEAFDKVAKLLGLPYPGGPSIEALAQEGNPSAFLLPRPMLGRDRPDFSFSGLKTAVRQLVQNPQFNPTQKADLAASFQAAVVETLVDRVDTAIRLFRLEHDVSSPALALAGGVAANTAIRASLARLASARGFTIQIAPAELCTDNAAMIAWAGVERHELGVHDDLDAVARARWPLVELRAERVRRPSSAVQP